MDNSFNTHFSYSTSAEVEMMKERFAKLLLGEDMSGGGKGVCTALAISNAITNLSGRFQSLGVYRLMWLCIYIFKCNSC